MWIHIFIQRNKDWQKLCGAPPVVGDGIQGQIPKRCCLAGTRLSKYHHLAEPLCGFTQLQRSKLARSAMFVGVFYQLIGTLKYMSLTSSGSKLGTKQNKLVFLEAAPDQALYCIEANSGTADK